MKHVFCHETARSTASVIDAATKNLAAEIHKFLQYLRGPVLPDDVASSSLHL